MHRTTIAIALVALTSSCSQSEELGETTQDVGWKEVFVDDTGRFFPRDLVINEGDQVVFSRLDQSDLRPMDSILRTTAAVASAAPCDLGAAAYDTSTVDPSDVNELTGPLRPNPSGIYALAPDVPDGPIEGPVYKRCEALAVEAVAEGRLDSAVLEAGEAWQETLFSFSFPTFELDRTYPNGTPLNQPDFAGVPGGTQTLIGPMKRCTKVIDNGDGTTTISKFTNSRYLLESVWDSPGVAGAVVRIDWKAMFSKGTDGTLRYDFTQLDRELDEAARRGKLVFLQMAAGSGTPEWLFTDAKDSDVPRSMGDTGLVARTVKPVALQDWGSFDDAQPASCGFPITLGSPSDPAYRTAFLLTVKRVATHIRGSAARFAALGSFEVTGLNLFTAETRLPRRCEEGCPCNTEIWASAGYTAEAAQQFLNLVENQIWKELGRRKTMHYMLIQDGLPKVVDATHYDTFRIHEIPPNEGFVDGAGNEISYSKPTEVALDQGQASAFSSVSPSGDSQPTTVDPEAAWLFSPMHAALGRMPVAEILRVSACPGRLWTTIYNGKLEGIVERPRPAERTDFMTFQNGAWTAPPLCPNRWAATEGAQGQIIGYQNPNDLANSDDVSSSLWNATLNTNAVFVEIYQHRLWLAEQERLLERPFLSDSVAGFAETPERQKSLVDWNLELHRRRRTISQFPESAGHANLADPFPARYRFKFGKNLRPGQSEKIYFIDPGARCQSASTEYGTITVVGK